MLKICTHEYEFKRFNLHENQNIECTNFMANLISVGNYKPNLTLQIFVNLQILNDLSRSFCLSRRPEQCKIYNTLLLFIYFILY